MSSRDHRPPSLQNPPTARKRKSAPPPVEFLQFSRLVDNPDRYSPNALKMYVPPEVQERIDAIPPQYLKLSERQFRIQFQVDETDGRLRLRFWDLYDRSTQTSEPMALADIYQNVCSQEHFWDRVMANPVKLAWILLPPVDPELSMREVFYRGLDKFREIVSMPVMKKVPVMEGGKVVRDKDGSVVCVKEPDKIAIAEIRRVVTYLADRYQPRGGKRYSVPTAAHEVKSLPPSDFDSMEAEILEMEKRLADEKKS